jgi:hypothetical protein
MEGGGRGKLCLPKTTYPSGFLPLPLSPPPSAYEYILYRPLVLAEKKKVTAPSIHPSIVPLFFLTTSRRGRRKMKEKKSHKKSGRNTNVTHQPGLKICFTSYFDFCCNARKKKKKCRKMCRNERERETIRKGNVLLWPSAFMDFAFIEMMMSRDV